MKITILTPAFYPAVGGNATTVGRWKRHLERRGHAVQVIDVSRAAVPNLLRVTPDVIHCHHAVKAGEHLASLLDCLPAPLVVSLPGTDINEDRRRSRPMARLLDRARAVIVSNRAMIARVRSRFDVPRSRIHYIPRGVDRPGGSFPLRRALGIPPGDLVILFPAGIRPVKNQLFPIEPLSGVRARLIRGGGPAVHLVCVGPVLDADYADRLRQRIRSHSWIHLMGSVPLRRMGGLYRQADIVLNCSLAEGMPNNILEAMAAGRVVVASDIPGNRDILVHGRSGFLYRGRDEFIRIIERLLPDQRRREAIGRRARGVVKRFFSADRELKRLLDVYRKVARM